MVAQLVVRYLEDSVKEALRRRAARRRRSLEAEVRDILRDAVARSDRDEPRLGSRIARRFAGIGLTRHIPEVRGHLAQPASFKP